MSYINNCIPNNAIMTAIKEEFLLAAINAANIIVVILDFR